MTEDYIVCKSFIATSVNPIAGRAQKGKAFKNKLYGIRSLRLYLKIYDYLCDKTKVLLYKNNQNKQKKRIVQLIINGNTMVEKTALIKQALRGFKFNDHGEPILIKSKATTTIMSVFRKMISHSILH